MSRRVRFTSAPENLVHDSIKSTLRDPERPVLLLSSFYPVLVKESVTEISQDSIFPSMDFDFAEFQAKICLI
jgi:hypothetical protein